MVINLEDEIIHLNAKIEQGIAEIPDYKRMIDIQSTMIQQTNKMLADQIRTADRLFAVAERQQGFNEMLKEAHDHAMTAWLMNRHTPFEYGGSA